MRTHTHIHTPQHFVFVVHTAALKWKVTLFCVSSKWENYLDPLLLKISPTVFHFYGALYATDLCVSLTTTCSSSS